MLSDNSKIYGQHLTHLVSQHKLKCNHSVIPRLRALIIKLKAVEIESTSCKLMNVNMKKILQFHGIIDYRKGFGEFMYFLNPINNTISIELKVQEDKFLSPLKAGIL